MTNRVGRVALLVGLWVLLWGDVSVANVVAGALVAVALLVIYPTARQLPRDRGRLRPLATARLAVHVLAQFVVSNALVAREIVTPGSRIRTGIVACPLRTRSSSMMSFVANVLALSPGTMPVDVTDDPPTVYVHVLHLHDPDRTRRDVAMLEALAIRAFGSDVDRAAVATSASTKAFR